jgi:hypothetical protein
MPMAMAQRPPSPLLPLRADLPRLLCVAAAYAAAELLLTVAFGRFVEWGRAEALLFLQLRPWLLLAAASLVSDRDLVSRLFVYASALLMAASSETLLILRLGADDPWPEMLRGLAAAALLLIPIEMAVQLGRRWGRIGLMLFAAGTAILMAVGGLRPYTSLVEGPLAAHGGSFDKPLLLMMSGLPIVWGEGGPFDSRSRPAKSYQALQQEFRIQPVDTLDPRTLAAGRLLLLAQPQRLNASELAAVDGWIRGGGHALILDDPALVWPSELPLGDIRRPPPIGLLGPLLAHWGLSVEAPVQSERLAERWGGRRVVTEAPGRLRSARHGCALAGRDWAAVCLLGEGKVVLIADADLMRDELWAARGAGRSRRSADNPLLLADILDWLGGIERPRVGGDVAWAEPWADPGQALLLALLPIAGGAGAAGVLRARRRRR